jgi:hypothetical protein
VAAGSAVGNELSESELAGLLGSLGGIPIKFARIRRLRPRKV